MTFTELKERIKKLELLETREDSPEYFEFVIRSNYANQLNMELEGYFGPPLKPADKSPSRQMEIYADPYGGVRTGQTLFFKEYDGVSNLALLWPWGNGECITVKIAQAQQTTLNPPPGNFWQRLFKRSRLVSA